MAVLAAIFGSIGYGVSQIASYKNYELFILIFAAPAVPILILYVLICFLIFSPTAYIIANNDGISAGETIGACYRSMINNGKMTVFLSYFISGFIKLLYLGALGVGGYFLFTLFIPGEYFVVALIGYAIIALIGYLLFAPVFTLANRVVKEHLFEDIVLDPVTVARINEKVNLSICDGKKLGVEMVNQNLASLFEYTEDPYKIIEKTEKKSQEYELDAVKVKKATKNEKNKESVGAQDNAEEEQLTPTVEPEAETVVQTEPVSETIQPTTEPGIDTDLSEQPVSAIEIS